MLSPLGAKLGENRSQVHSQIPHPGSHHACCHHAVQMVLLALFDFAQKRDPHDSQPDTASTASRPLGHLRLRLL